MRPTTFTYLALLLSLSACTCEPDDRPERAPQPAASELKRKYAEAFPVPPGELLDTDALIPFVPDKLASFTATKPPDPRESAVANGGTLPVIRREYMSEGMALQLEISDTLQAPAVAKIIEHQHMTAQPLMGAVLKPTVIRGRPALSHLQPDQRKATINVLLRKRLLINVKISNAESLDPALAVADAIDYDGLSALLPADAPQDSISANTEPAAATAEGAQQEAAQPGGEDAIPAEPAEVPGTDEGAATAQPAAAQPAAAEPSKP